MSQTTTLAVDRMNCAHCLASVTEELSALPGVEDVSVDLRVGASSPVTVVSGEPLDDAAISAAVQEAGYAVTPRGSLL